MDQMQQVPPGVGLDQGWDLLAAGAFPGNEGVGPPEGAQGEVVGAQLEALVQEVGAFQIQGVGQIFAALGVIPNPAVLAAPYVGAGEEEAPIIQNLAFAALEVGGFVEAAEAAEEGAAEAAEEGAAEGPQGAPVGQEAIAGAPEEAEVIANAVFFGDANTWGG